MPPFPPLICVSSSGSLPRETYIYAPGAGGIPGLIYHIVDGGFIYFIRFNNPGYQFIYFQSIFNQQVLYTADNLTGPWRVSNGLAPAPTVVVGECTNPPPYILNNVTISKVTAKKVSGKG